MSGSGKSLQDIYDEGSKRLDESEQTQRQILEVSGAHGVDELGHVEAAMIGKMDSSVAELETEIHSYLDKAVESINAAVSSEVEENRKFIERLQETLRLSCRSLSEDVRQLRESLAQKSSSSADHAIALQRGELDKGISQIKVDGGTFTSQLKELSQVDNSGFNARGAIHVLHVLDKSVKVPAEFFIEFSRHAISIDKRINDCVQLLSSRSREIVSDIGTGGTEVRQTIDQLVQQLLVQMEETYKQSDAQLIKHCEDALSAALRHQEELATKLATDLLESNQSNGSGIGEKSKALKTDTDHLLEQVKQLLADVNLGVRDNCTGLNDNFEKALVERLADAREHNQMVADERSKLMERIAGDLQEIETNFETRLSQLAQKCQARLSSVCVDAELAIVAAHDVCAAEFKTLSAQQQKAIEEKTQQLLTNISTLSSQATMGIKAAGGDTGASNPLAQTVPQTAPQAVPPLGAQALPPLNAQAAPQSAAPIVPQPPTAAPGVPQLPPPTTPPPAPEAAPAPAPTPAPQPAAPQAAQPAASPPSQTASQPASEPAPENIGGSTSNPFGDFGDLKL